MSKFQEESLIELENILQGYISEVVASITRTDFSKQEKTILTSQTIIEMITKTRKRHLKSIKKEPGSTRTNMLFLDILSELKILVLHINNIYKSFRDFSENNKKVTFDMIKAIQ